MNKETGIEEISSPLEVIGDRRRLTILACSVGRDMYLRIFRFITVGH